MYGISGAPLAAQVPLWRCVAERLLALGRPYVLTGDWQVSPAEMQSARFPELIGGQIVAPSAATNLRTGTIIDYFVVADILCADPPRAHVIHGCRFKPHAPVRLDVTLGISRAPVRRLAIPRPLSRRQSSRAWPWHYYELGRMDC